jgi:hypothetical protein
MWWLVLGSWCLDRLLWILLVYSLRDFLRNDGCLECLFNKYHQSKNKSLFFDYFTYLCMVNELPN